MSSLIVKDVPLVVNANATALIGVVAYTLLTKCECGARVFSQELEVCKATTCLNGGTCQLVDNAIK